MFGDYHYFQIKAARDCLNNWDEDSFVIEFHDGIEPCYLIVKSQWHHIPFVSVRENQDALYAWLDVLNIRQGFTKIGILFQTEMEKIFDAFLRIKLAEALKSEVDLPTAKMQDHLVCAQQELKEVSDPRKIYLARLP